MTEKARVAFATKYLRAVLGSDIPQCFLSRLQFACGCGDSTKGSRRVGTALSVHCETSVGTRKVGGAVGGDVQADIENALVRWDKFDSAEVVWR